jgi:hypothetical protein
MTPNTKRSEQNNDGQHPQGITKQDWDKTPFPVRKFIISILGSNQKHETKSKDYTPMWSTWSMILVNLAIVFSLTLLLANKISLQCITSSQVSAASVAFVSLAIFHVIWRNFYILIPPNFDETIKLGVVTIPLTILITILNEIHPWKLSSRLLGFSLIIFSALALFLNLHPYSPFHKGGGLLAIPSFMVQRLDSPSPEQLAPGGTLTIKAGEKVFLELALLGETQVLCTWFTTSSSENAIQGCSILLDVPSPIKRDVLTVFMQPVCGSRQESVSLNVIVQP